MKESSLNIIEKDDEFCITSPDALIAVSDFSKSTGIDVIKKVKITTKSENNDDESSITQVTDSINCFANSYGDVEIFTFVSSDIFVQDFTGDLKVANTEIGFENAGINISHVIYVNSMLNEKELIKIYKNVTKAKAKFLADLNLPLHIDNILNTDDFLAVIANKNGENKEINLNIEEAVEITMEDAFNKLNLSFGVLDYLVAEGILIGDLIEAGMELLGGIEVSDDFEKKMENELLKALTDINVVTLIMAAIRTEDDLNRIREIDSTYLYADEVLGMAVANQIAGTKAALNFKHYIEEKPGIIYGLSPMLNDVFAGLISGCISKALENTS